MTLAEEMAGKHCPPSGCDVEAIVNEVRERAIEECCAEIRKRLPKSPTCVTSADADEVIAMLRALHH